MPFVTSFWYGPPVSIELGRRLIAAGIVPAEEVEAALFVSLSRGVSFVRTLIDRGTLSEAQLDAELEGVGLPWSGELNPMPALVSRLPQAMCRRLAALPVRHDPETGALEVAAADPLDPLVLSEFAFHFDAEIRILRAGISAIEAAIERHGREKQEPIPLVPVRKRRLTPAAPYGAPRSSSPPPPSEETPIPLVRKVSPPGGRTPEPPRVEEQTPTAKLSTVDDDDDDDVVLPLRTTKMEPHPKPELSLLPVGISLVPQLGVPPAADSEGQGRPRRNTLKLLTPADFEQTLAARASVENSPPSPRVVRPPDGRAIFAALERATTRDEIVRLTLRGIHLCARRFAIFALRRDVYHGWTCNVAFGDEHALRAIAIPASEPSILATAAATRIYLGPIPTTAAHEALLAVMEQSSNDVAAVAALAGGRVAMVLLADELGDTMLGTRFLEELARAVGEAFLRLLAPKG